MSRRRTFYALILTTLLVSLLFGSPKANALAEMEGVNVFFLGSIGGAGSGSQLRLFGVLHGAVAVQISADDENVTAFDMASDLSKVAYTVSSTNTIALRILQLQPRTVTVVVLPELVTAEKVYLFPNAIWVIGTNPNKKPTLLGIDPVQGNVISQHAMRLNDSNITLHSSGNFAIAFSPSGALGVFKLPEIKKVNLGLTGYAGSTPLWSPSAERFVIVTAPITNQNDWRVTLVDVAGKPRIAHVAVPHFDKNAKMTAVWSDYGRYVIFSGTDFDAKGNVVKTSANLIDTTNNSVTPLNNSGENLTVLAWAPQDAAAVVLSRPGPPKAGSGEIAKASLLVYDPASKKFAPLNGPSTVEFSSAKWNPVSPTLGLVGVAPSLKQYGLFIGKSPSFDLSKWVLVTNDVTVIESALYWTSDGTQMLLVNGASVNADQSGGAPNSMGAIYSFDPTSGAVARLSPEGIAIDATALEIR